MPPPSHIYASTLRRGSGRRWRRRRAVWPFALLGGLTLALAAAVLVAAVA